MKPQKIVILRFSVYESSKNGNFEAWRVRVLFGECRLEGYFFVYGEGGG